MNNRAPLPAGTTLGKSHEYGIDINLGTFGSPDWQPIRRMSAFNPTFPPVNTDVGTYDDEGAPNNGVTGRGFATGFTVQANRNPLTGLYLPEYERLIAASRAKGEGAEVDIRFYHKPSTGAPNPNDAGRALATVEMSRSDTGNAGVEVGSVSLTGKGEYMPIANPFTGWGATAPQIAYVGPDGATDGALVTVTGAGLLTATAVNVDGAPVLADEYMIVNDSTIVLQLPVGAAGVVPVTVTNPAGTSNPYSFNRGE